jgi:hypothetical protein
MMTWRSYDDMAGGDVSISDWQFWANHLLTRGKVLANDKVPCGPVVGCHVAPRYWYFWLFDQNCIGVRGV